MKKTRMRVWSILLTVLMLLTLLPISAMAEEAPVAMIGETTYTSLYDAVAAAKDGDTIKLLGNASGRGIIIDSSKYAETGLTIDFNGFTYTVDESPLAGSPGTESQCFQLLTGGKVTMKGGTVNSTNTGVAMVLQNYCDLTLDGMVIDGSGMTGTGTYTMSNNCGNVVIKDTTVIAKEGDVAFDVYGGFSDYSDVTVTVKGSSVIDGKVEVDHANGDNQNKNTLNIEGGTFKDEIDVKSTWNEKTSVTVTGGAFSQVPSDYIGEDVTQFVCNGVTYVGTSAVDGAHSWKLISTLKEATCTTDGLGKFECEYCKVTKYAIIPAAHTWELTETVKEATCGEAGEALYTCSVCGETKTEVIEATGAHNFEEKLVEATCTENAKAGLVCTVCGATDGELVEVPDSKIPHDYETVTVDATCVTDGSITKTCKVCGDEQVETIPATGKHTEEVVGAKAPTCTEAGHNEGVKCSVCGEILYGMEEIPATGEHTPVPDAAVEPTCKTPGKTEGSHCSVCNEVLVAQEEIPIDPDAHDYELTNALKEPTCTTTGIGKYVCSYCGASKYEVIAAEHKWDEGEVTQEATCTEAGQMTYTCTVCQETKTEEIAALGHSWNDGEITTPATCGAAGEKTYTCQREECGEAKTEVIPATGEHNYQEGYVDATCTENAKVGMVCTVCGATDGELVEVPDSKIPHDYETVTVDATCVTDGSITKTCKVCGDEQVETIPATGKHTEEVVGAKAPTCTEAGHNEGVKCSVCGEILYGMEEIPATGEHTPVPDAAVEPTCKTPGKTEGSHCSVCNEVLVAQEEIPIDSDAHDYDLTNTLKPATCTTTGIGSYKCKYCDKTAYLTIAKLEHNWDEGIVTKEPTCTEDGEKTVTCTVCGAEDTVSIPNLGGHQWIEDLVDDVTNVVYKECSVCGEQEIIWSDNDALKDCFAGNHTPVEIPETETHYAGKKCSVCGTILEEPLAKCAHENTQLENVKKATCTEAGYTGDLVCQDCDQTIEDGNVVPATGHTVITDAAVEATCTTDGKTEGSHCSVCDTVIVEQETVPAKGHTEEILPGKAATCTETGLTEGKKCSVCGEVLVAQEEISMVPHNYEDGACTVCGANDPDYVAPCTHENTETKNAVAATCTEDGYTGDTVCTDCGETLQTGSVISATGHTIVTDAAVEATCTTDGKTEGSHCSICGTVIVAQQTIPATGHTEEVIPGKAATCTETGLTEGKKCSVCGEVLVEQEVLPMVAHHYEDGVCTVCGAEDPNYVAPCTHENTETKNAVAATCTEAGYTGDLVCQDCGATIETGTVIPAAGHTVVTDAAVEATCTTDGKTEGSHCSACGTVIVAQETVPAKGHTVVEVPEVPATEESAGTTAGTKCSVCGEILSGCETIPPLSHEHVWDGGVETKAPTCTEAGEMTYTCSCGETRVETIPATGHSYKVSVSYNEDYTKIIYTYTCTVCGDSYKEEFDL